MRALLSGISLLFGLAVPIASGAGAPPKAEQLSGWIRDLDAQDFSVREAACGQLAAAGDSAVEALCACIASGSPEARWRASATLQRIVVESRCEETAARAAALLKSGEGDARAFAGMIESLAARRFDSRRQGAANSIRALGGRFENSRSIGNHELPPLGKTPAEPPAPPPNVPLVDVGRGAHPFAENEAKGATALGEVLIADAYVAPELEETSSSKQRTTSLTLDSSWRGGDLALAELRDLPEITEIRLEQAPVTDAALEHLVVLPRLDRLTIDRTPLTAAGLARFRDSRPRTQIVVSDVAGF